MQITTVSPTSITFNSSQNYTGINWQVVVSGNYSGSQWYYKGHNDNYWSVISSTSVSYNSTHTIFNLQNVNVYASSNSNELRVLSSPVHRNLTFMVVKEASDTNQTIMTNIKNVMNANFDDNTHWMVDFRWSSYNDSVSNSTAVWFEANNIPFYLTEEAGNNYPNTTLLDNISVYAPTMFKGWRLHEKNFNASNAEQQSALNWFVNSGNYTVWINYHGGSLRGWAEWIKNNSNIAVPFPEMNQVNQLGDSQGTALGLWLNNISKSWGADVETWYWSDSGYGAAPENMPPDVLQRAYTTTYLHGATYFGHEPSAGMFTGSNKATLSALGQAGALFYKNITNGWLPKNISKDEVWQQSPIMIVYPANFSSGYSILDANYKGYLGAFWSPWDNASVKNSYVVPWIIPIIYANYTDNSFMNKTKLIIYSDNIGGSHSRRYLVSNDSVEIDNLITNTINNFQTGSYDLFIAGHQGLAFRNSTISNTIQYVNNGNFNAFGFNYSNINESSAVAWGSYFNYHNVTKYNFELNSLKKTDGKEVTSNLVKNSSAFWVVGIGYSYSTTDTNGLLMYQNNGRTFLYDPTNTEYWYNTGTNGSYLFNKLYSYYFNQSRLSISAPVLNTSDRIIVYDPYEVNSTFNTTFNISFTSSTDVWGFHDKSFSKGVTVKNISINPNETLIYFYGTTSTFNLTSIGVTLYDNTGAKLDNGTWVQITKNTSTSITFNSTQNYTNTNWQISVVGDLTGKTWKYKAHNDNTWLTVPAANISYNGSHTLFNLQNIDVSQASNSNELLGTDTTMNFTQSITDTYNDTDVTFSIGYYNATIEPINASCFVSFSGANYSAIYSGITGLHTYTIETSVLNGEYPFGVFCNSTSFNNQYNMSAGSFIVRVGQGGSQSGGTTGGTGSGTQINVTQNATNTTNTTTPKVNISATNTTLLGNISKTVQDSIAPIINMTTNFVTLAIDSKSMGKYSEPAFGWIAPKKINGHEVYVPNWLFALVSAIVVDSIISRKARGQQDYFDMAMRVIVFLIVGVAVLYGLIYLI